MKIYQLLLIITILVFFCNETYYTLNILCVNLKKNMSMSANDRWVFIQNKKFCQKGSHSYKKKIITKEVCNNKKCNSSHHKLLHIA